MLCHVFLNMTRLRTRARYEVTMNNNVCAIARLCSGPCLAIESELRLAYGCLNFCPSTPSERIYERNSPAYRLTNHPHLQVIDTRPPNARPNLTDTSNVDKYVMPEEEYAQKTDSVLAWKKAQKLGRFDPNVPAMLEAKVAAFAREAEERGIVVGKRCRVGGEDTRRGAVMYVGEVPEIATGPGTWVGVRLDEPVGKNDGSIKGKRYWGEGEGQLHGLFVRPERVEVGDFPPLDDLLDDEDMEEI